MNTNNTIMEIKFFLCWLLAIINYKIHKNRNIPDPEEIIINRTDLIGDAITTLPALIALKKQFRGKITVHTTRYNDWVLRPFLNTTIVKEAAENESLTKVIIERIRTKFSKINKTPIIFVNLNSSYRDARENADKYIVDFKSLPSNLNADYIINENNMLNGALSNSERLALAAKEILGLELKMQEYPDELKQFIEKQKDMKLNNKSVIFCVNNKQYRNFNKEWWNRLAKNLDEPYFIVDRNDYDLWQLVKYAGKAKLVVGLDGGCFHFLQQGANAVELVLYVSPMCWKPFSLNKYETVYNYESIVMKTSITSQGLRKGIIYRNDNNKIKYELAMRKDEELEQKFNPELIANLIKNNIILNLKK